MTGRNAIALGVAVTTVITSPIRGAAQEVPAPPKLERGADVNDWEDYYKYGVSMVRRSPSKADAAFYWAGRLNPTRAEPLYGRWVAFWMLDISEFPDYLRESPRVLQDPRILAGDSLRFRAWERNPLVNQALLMLLYEKLPGAWGEDPFTKGWLSYANGFYPSAVELFENALAHDTNKYWMRYDIALVYTQMRRYDSAASQMTQLLDEMRKEDRKKLVHFYESKEMFEYALGLLYAARGDLGNARQALGRALEENLAFAPAHAALGRLAAVRRDTATAVTEYGLAVELAANDGAMRYWYGAALLRADRPADAAEQLTTAVRLEPYFAEPYEELGKAYEAMHDTTNAVGAYAGYLKRAPRNSVEDVARARERISALGGKAP